METQSQASISALVGSAITDGQTLLKQEIELAKAELSISAKHAAASSGMFIGAAVLGIFGGQDEIVTPDRVEALRRALAAAGVRASLHVEPAAGHGFMNDARPDRHSGPAAAEGWRRLLAFLRAELS